MKRNRLIYMIFLFTWLQTSAYIPLVKKIKATSMGGIVTLKASESFPKTKQLKSKCQWVGDEADEDYHHTLPPDCNYRDLTY